MRVMRDERCERARRWISIALDDELAELEERLLATHLTRCAECRAFERRTRAVTEGLRSAELVPLGRQLTLPVRRRLTGVRVASASAAAAAVLAVVGGLTLATSTDQVRPAFLTQPASVMNTEVVDARELRRTELVPHLAGPHFSHVQMARRDRV
jgi:Putative zinc-finger